MYVLYLSYVFKVYFTFNYTVESKKSVLKYKNKHVGSTNIVKKDYIIKHNGFIRRMCNWMISI